MTALGSATQRAGSAAAQVVAAIAAVELPHYQWTEVIEILLRFMDNAENTNLRIATLQAIGYLCESIVRKIFSLCLSTYAFLITET